MQNVTSETQTLDPEVKDLKKCYISASTITCALTQANKRFRYSSQCKDHNSQNDSGQHAPTLAHM